MGPAGCVGRNRVPSPWPMARRHGTDPTAWHPIVGAGGNPVKQLQPKEDTLTEKDSAAIAQTAAKIHGDSQQTAKPRSSIRSGPAVSRQATAFGLHKVCRIFAGLPTRVDACWKCHWSCIAGSVTILSAPETDAPRHSAQARFARRAQHTNCDKVDRRRNGDVELCARSIFAIVTRSRFVAGRTNSRIAALKLHPMRAVFVLYGKLCPRGKGYAEVHGRFLRAQGT